MTLTEHWHELVTTALLGTDRRDPPDPPPGPLADLVDDTVAPTPSARMLAAVAGSVAARRAGVRPLPPAAPPIAPAADPRPLVSPTAARRWWSVVATWPVLEDEWLAVVERSGQRLPPDVLVGLLRRHRTDGVRRARVHRIGGSLVVWLLDHEPSLRTTTPLRTPPDDPLPGLAVPPDLLGLLDAGPDAVVPVIVAGFRARAFDLAHRAVLVNFVARAPSRRPRAAGRGARCRRAAAHERRARSVAGRARGDPRPPAGRAPRECGGGAPV